MAVSELAQPGVLERNDKWAGSDGGISVCVCESVVAERPSPKSVQRACDCGHSFGTHFYIFHKSIASHPFSCEWFGHLFLLFWWFAAAAESTTIAHCQFIFAWDTCRPSTHASLFVIPAFSIRESIYYSTQKPKTKRNKFIANKYIKWQSEWEREAERQRKMKRNQKRTTMFVLEIFIFFSLHFSLRCWHKRLRWSHVDIICLFVVLFHLADYCEQKVNEQASFMAHNHNNRECWMCTE